MNRYRIHKIGRTWRLYHWHGPNGGWHGPIAESSNWKTVAWIATGEPSYRVPGWQLWPVPCNT